MSPTHGIGYIYPYTGNSQRVVSQESQSPHLVPLPVPFPLVNMPVFSTAPSSISSASPRNLTPVLDGHFTNFGKQDSSAHSSSSSSTNTINYTSSQNMTFVGPGSGIVIDDELQNGSVPHLGANITTSGASTVVLNMVSSNHAFLSTSTTTTSTPTPTPTFSPSPFGTLASTSAFNSVPHSRSPRSERTQRRHHHRPKYRMRTEFEESYNSGMSWAGSAGRASPTQGSTGSRTSSYTGSRQGNPHHGSSTLGQNITQVQHSQPSHLQLQQQHLGSNHNHGQNHHSQTLNQTLGQGVIVYGQDPEHVQAYQDTFLGASQPQSQPQSQPLSQQLSHAQLQHQWLASQHQQQQHLQLQQPQQQNQQQHQQQHQPQFQSHGHRPSGPNLTTNPTFSTLPHPSRHNLVQYSGQHSGQHSGHEAPTGLSLPGNVFPYSGSPQVSVPRRIHNLVDASYPSNSPAADQDNVYGVCQQVQTQSSQLHIQPTGMRGNQGLQHHTTVEVDFSVSIPSSVTSDATNSSALENSGLVIACDGESSLHLHHNVPMNMHTSRRYYNPNTPSLGVSMAYDASVSSASGHVSTNASADLSASQYGSLGGSRGIYYNGSIPGVVYTATSGAIATNNNDRNTDIVHQGLYGEMALNNFDPGHPLMNRNSNLVPNGVFLRHGNGLNGEGMSRVGSAPSYSSLSHPNQSGNLPAATYDGIMPSQYHQFPQQFPQQFANQRGIYHPRSRNGATPHLLSVDTLNMADKPVSIDGYVPSTIIGED